MASYLLTFTPVPGSYGTSIEYRRSDANIWTAAPNTPTTLTSYTLTVPDDGFNYVVRFSAYGGRCTPKYTYKTLVGDTVYDWEVGDFYCEKGTPLSLIETITGFADPARTGYDSVTGRIYVVDSSAITQGSNIYWFNPNTISSAGDVTAVGAINVAALASVIDSAARKIYITGPNTSGLIIYNIATNTVTNVPFGSNGLYGRLTLEKFGNLLLCVDQYSQLVTVVDTNTNTVVTNTAYTSIPSYAQRFSGGPIVRRINGEWWVMNSQGATFGAPASSVARYNDDFSVLIGTISLPGQLTWTNGAYWRSAYLNGTDLLVYDAGSNQLMNIDTTDLSVTSIHTFSNREGKSNSYLVISQDPITFEFYISGAWTNDANIDVNPIPITYRLNSVTYEPEAIYPTIAYGNQLTRVGNTDVLIGTFGGVQVYPSNPVGAATDGDINIFDKSSAADNTGYVIVLTIEEIGPDGPTGNTKINDPSDEHYIAPYIDLTACPIVYDIVCPDATFTNSTGEYEYSLKPSTGLNPAINNINLVQVDTVTSSVLATTVVPKNLYQNGTLTKIGSNPNRVDLIFKNVSNVTIGTCTNIFTLT